MKKIATTLRIDRAAEDVYPYASDFRLRHAFAKLDVSNRVALAAVVHRSIE
jgi:hypothetical protein